MCFLKFTTWLMQRIMKKEARRLAKEVAVLVLDAYFVQQWRSIYGEIFEGNYDQNKENVVVCKVLYLTLVGV